MATGLHQAQHVNAMAGREPELAGLARMVGNGVWLQDVSWNKKCEIRKCFLLNFAKKPCSCILGPVGKLHAHGAMAPKRKASFDPYEEELRDLLTYDCPLTGMKRCPPSLNEHCSPNTAVMNTMIPSCNWLILQECCVFIPMVAGKDSCVFGT